MRNYELTGRGLLVLSILIAALALGAISVSAALGSETGIDAPDLSSVEVVPMTSLSPAPTPVAEQTTEPEPVPTPVAEQTTEPEQTSEPTTTPIAEPTPEPSPTPEPIVVATPAPTPTLPIVEPPVSGTQSEPVLEK